MSGQAERDSSAAYAGRWVARLDGRIVAHGGTPEQAEQAAKRSRPKERATISYMANPPGFSLSPLVETVRAALPDQEVYLVGGAVRDALLGHVSHDLDFTVPRNAIALARQVANQLHADFYILDEQFDAARVIVRGEAGRDFLDFSSFRTTAARRGAGEQAASTLEDDLRGRDLTVNALAYDLRAGTMLDPLNGAADVRAKLLRMCAPSAMQDDPIRILRTVRLAAALDFKIEPNTRRAMKEAAAGLRRISAERQRDELFKTLEGRRPEAAMRALEMLGVLPYVLPELSALKGVTQSPPHVFDVWEHTLSVLQYTTVVLDSLRPNYDAGNTNDVFTGLLSLRLGRYREQLAAHLAKALNPERSLRGLLLFTALYHDVSKPPTRTIEDTGRIRFFGHEEQGAQVAARRGQALNLSNAEVERMTSIIANHMRFHSLTSRLEGQGEAPSRRAIYRFFRDAGEAGIDVVLLGLADLRGTRVHTLTQETWTAALDVARLLLENYWEKPEEAVSPPRLVDGNELMVELGMTPGPLVGELLAALREAQAVGKVSDREQALGYARQWLAGPQSGSSAPKE